jgi:hypothetical protein
MLTFLSVIIPTTIEENTIFNHGHYSLIITGYI